MGKFPVDAPKSRVIKALEMLGFQMLREREHVDFLIPRLCLGMPDLEAPPPLS